MKQKDDVIYLRGLNGLRAIAAIAVVISHTFSPTFGDFGVKFQLKIPFTQFGVTMFFVISGFLITYLLINEQKSTQNIAIKKFYIRRILRIWPIYYLVIFGLPFLFMLSGEKLDTILNQNTLWYLFFAANIPFILHTGIDLIVHFWSIGVEEQFYLVWPHIVKKWNRLLVVCVVLICVLITLKIFFWYLLGTSSIAYRTLSVTRIHCMLIGGVGSILYIEKKRWFLRFCTNQLVQFGSWLSLILVGFGLLHIPAIIAHESVAFVSLVIIIGQIYSTKSIFSLETKPFNFLGKISYGIYVYHTIVIYGISKLIKMFEIDRLPKIVLAYVSVLATTIFFSYVSYTYFEKYFLKMKDAFAVIKSTNEPVTS
jgi:peptidoglycan/LPS O-acetylase OafA/YrhL